MSRLKKFFWIAVLILTILFAAQNMHGIEIRLLPFAPSDDSITAIDGVPLIFVILAALLIGLLVGVMLENDRERPFRRELNEKARELSHVRSELAKLQSALKQSDTPETAALLLPKR
ncbi:MAG: hypothetical protein AAFW46_10560 [Pseudomonadota bacterium]